MENTDHQNIIADPQNYSDEWFDAATMNGREFQLPNLPNTAPNWSLRAADYSVHRSVVSPDAGWANMTTVDLDALSNPVNEAHFPLPEDEPPAPDVLVQDQQGSSSENQTSGVEIDQTDVLSLVRNQEVPDVDIKPADESKGKEVVLLELPVSDESSGGNLNAKGKRIADEEEPIADPHTCLICNKRYRNDTALGGHIGSHAKENKLLHAMNEGETPEPSSDGASVKMLD